MLLETIEGDEVEPAKLCCQMLRNFAESNQLLSYEHIQKLVKGMFEQAQSNTVNALLNEL